MPLPLIEYAGVSISCSILRDVAAVERCGSAIIGRRVADADGERSGVRRNALVGEEGPRAVERLEVGERQSEAVDVARAHAVGIGAVEEHAVAADHAR